MANNKLFLCFFFEQEKMLCNRKKRIADKHDCSAAYYRWIFEKIVCRRQKANHQIQSHHKA